jgi:hypothetical protein
MRSQQGRSLRRRKKRKEGIIFQHPLALISRTLLSFFTVRNLQTRWLI